MIRRDDGGDWLIIEQAEHARLAVELARAWGNDRFPALAIAATGTTIKSRPPTGIEGRAWGRACAAFDAAIAHHDDGWKEWDRQPRLDPQTGRPRDFLEMRMRDSTAIWTRSIAELRENGFPLPAYAVSSHFCFLAERAQDRDRDPDDQQTAALFLAEQRALHAALEADADSAGTGDDFRAFGELGYRTVQFFDRLSLWLCCAERSQPQSLAVPTGGTVTLIPSPDNPREISIEPTPLGAAAIKLETFVKRLPAREYMSQAELESVFSTAPPERLNWIVGSA
jgi:hypothetical protein